MEKLTRRACRPGLGIGTGSRHSACLWGHHKYCEESRSPGPAGRTRCFAWLSMTGWRGISISYTGHSTLVDHYLAGVEAHHMPSCIPRRTGRRSIPFPVRTRTFDVPSSSSTARMGTTRASFLYSNWIWRSTRRPTLSGASGSSSRKVSRIPCPPYPSDCR